jgi:hypothetical protein
MLSQFRSCYPHGSLISELVQIDHGKYIVRALVQVEGVTLSTGLAAADTVEQAEDNARARALALLDLNKPSAPLPLPQESRDSASPPAHDPAAPVTPAQDDFVPRRARGNRAAAPITHTPLPSNDLTGSASGERKFPDLSTTPPQVPKVAPEPEPLPEPEAIALRAVPEAIARPTLTLVPEPTPAAVTQAATALPEESPTFASEEAVLVPTDANEPPVELSVPEAPFLSDVAEPLDFSEIIAKSNVELKRLRWTNEQGRNYLLQTYGKRSRQLLSDEELLEFLNYLSSLPTPVS